jgi:hypothetical protein
MITLIVNNLSRLLIWMMGRTARARPAPVGTVAA